MAELSNASGVPVATIKYYQREGLVPPGVKTGLNQVSYADVHAQRLRLIRALLDVGRLSVTSIRAVLAAIDTDQPLLYAFDVAQRALSEPLTAADVDPESLAAIDGVMAGWRVSAENPGRLAAARVLHVFGDAGQNDEAGWFTRYAAAALMAASADLDEVDARESREAKAEIVVIGTTLGDALFSGLRRAAQEHVASQRYPAPPYPTTPTSTGNIPAKES